MYSIMSMASSIPFASFIASSLFEFVSIADADIVLSTGAMALIIFLASALVQASLQHLELSPSAIVFTSLLLATTISVANWNLRAQEITYSRAFVVVSTYEATLWSYAVALFAFVMCILTLLVGVSNVVKSWLGIRARSDDERRREGDSFIQPSVGTIIVWFLLALFMASVGYICMDFFFLRHVRCTHARSTVVCSCDLQFFPERVTT
jgi:hypothetical protein